MSNNITKLKELLEEKKQKVETELDKEKIKSIEFLLNQSDIFFKLKTDTAIGILDFLGIKEDEMYDFYLSLISPEKFQKINRN